MSGAYELNAPAGEMMVAVKVTDMLGEEVLPTVALSAAAPPNQMKSLDQGDPVTEGPTLDA